MNKEQIVRELIDISSLMEIKGENIFKVKAYENAAEILHDFSGNMEEFLDLAIKGKLKGIGSQLSETIAKLFQDIEIPVFCELRKEVPQSLLALKEIPGLGAKKVWQLYQSLNIQNIEDLKAACLAGRLAGIKGFSEKSEKQILEKVNKYLDYSKQILLPEGLVLASNLKEVVAPYCGSIELAGEVRRIQVVIKEIVLIAVVIKEAQLLEVLNNSSLFSEIKVLKKEICGIFANKLAFKIIFSKEEEFAVELFKGTGCDSHVQEILSSIPKGNFQSEQEIYTEAKLAFIPPQCRENHGEIKAAKQYFLEKKIFPEITSQDIKGIIHVHSQYSDGKDSLEDMACHLRELGYQYLGISDHSRSAIYAGGLTLEKIKRQHQEIDLLNKKVTPFKIFKGIESDILADGSLDYEDSILESFDFVIASIHSRFTDDREKMTARIIKAVENPYTTILAHPSGRRLLEREAYEVDLKKVIDAAVKNNVVIEINGTPKRLDLDWSFLRYAKEGGLKLALTPDAHSKKGVKNIENALLVAQKAWLEKVDFINTLDLKEFEQYLKDARESKKKSNKD